MTACNARQGDLGLPPTTWFTRSLMFMAPVAVALSLVVTQLAPLQARPAIELNVQICANESTGFYPSLIGMASLFDTSTWVRAQQASAPQAEQGFWNPLGKAWLTHGQHDLLQLAYEIGYADGGDVHAKLLQAVLMQETIAGHLGRIGHLWAPIGKRSYGVMQVKVSAARDVLRSQPDWGHFSTDDQLIGKLMADDEFNMRVASAFLLYLREKTRSDHSALVAYNIGLRASRRVANPAAFRYVKRVKRYITKVVEPYNAQYLPLYAQFAANAAGRVGANSRL